MSIYNDFSAVAPWSKLPWRLRFRLLFVRARFAGGLTVKWYRGVWYVLKDDSIAVKPLPNEEYFFHGNGSITAFTRDDGNK